MRPLDKNALHERDALRRHATELGALHRVFRADWERAMLEDPGLLHTMVEHRDYTPYAAVQPAVVQLGVLFECFWHFVETQAIPYIWPERVVDAGVKKAMRVAHPPTQGQICATQG